MILDVNINEIRWCNYVRPKNCNLYISTKQIKFLFGVVADTFTSPAKIIYLEPAKLNIYK